MIEVYQPLAPGTGTSTGVRLSDSMNACLFCLCFLPLKLTAHDLKSCIIDITGV